MKLRVLAQALAGGLVVLANSAAAATVKVDLQPCFFSPEAMKKDDADTTDTYITSVFYQGYWGASQLATTASTTTTLDLTHSGTHGKCNVVYVGIDVSDSQKLQLQNYSRTFKVRIVYYNAAATANDAEVNSRLGISQDFSEPLVSAPFIKMAAAGAAVARVVPTTLTTDPRDNNLFARPVLQYTTATVNGTATIIADYVDSSGTTVQSSMSFPSVAAIQYESSDGYEEMHVFFSLAWFDVGSWAWTHFFVEWGTKGVFQGERRFYLGAVVDDLFLSTGVFDYNGGLNEGTEMRMTGTDMGNLKAAEASLNSKYDSSIVTEFAFNGLGILEKVDSAYVLDINDADIALLPKGQKVDGNGLDPQLPEGWMSTAVPGMTAEFAAGSWDSDTLLAWVIANLDTFWWQSHTLTHLARDNLGVSDCSQEDGANAQIAVLTGMFGSNSYNWRSMTNPGITGLFNKYCLASAVENLIKCAPGDNTYDGFQTSVSLLSSVSQFHSIYTTTSTNGYSGFQIVPRFATFVYYNCVTGACLVAENEYIRRIVCGCDEVDPSKDKGSCSECTGDISSFGSVENVFLTEAKTTTRQILTGRRDKYMFHQANVIATNLSGGSLLAYWYQEVMDLFSTFIAFPVTSNKFDDLCSEFTLHEDLDTSGALLTATVDNTSGDISSVSLSSSGTSGYIPFTVPSTSKISTSGLTVGSTTTYGSDVTYYISTSSSAIPTPASAPSSSELAPIGTATESSATIAVTITPIWTKVSDDTSTPVVKTDAPVISATSVGVGDALTPAVDTDPPVSKTSPPLHTLTNAPVVVTSAPVGV